MLPSRSQLQGWNPDSLTPAGEAVDAAGTSVYRTVRGLEDAIDRMPETRAWAGKSHDAAAGMFSRATERASAFTSYAEAVGSAFKSGGNTIGGARFSLLRAADGIDEGELQVSDVWVVLIKPVRMSEAKIAELQARAAEEQAEINRLLLAVGDADDDTADAMQAAAQRYGFELPDQSLSWLNLGDLPPDDQVPNPRTPDGMETQATIRNAYQAATVREVTEVFTSQADLVTTVVMQDGSKKVATRHNPFTDPSKSDFCTITEYDKAGHKLASTHSWHELSNNSNITEIEYPNGSVWTTSMDSSGTVHSRFITPDGRSSTVPVEMVDKLSTYAGAGVSGLQAHITRGGQLPMVSAESIAKIGGAARVAGPGLAAATAVYDMAMAQGLHGKCSAAIAGLAGGGGGWGGAKAGAFAGALVPGFEPLTVPALALAGGLYGASKGTDLGKFVGDIVCPY